MNSSEESNRQRLLKLILPNIISIVDDILVPNIDNPKAEFSAADSFKSEISTFIQNSLNVDGTKYLEQKKKKMEPKIPEMFGKIKKNNTSKFSKIKSKQKLGAAKKKSEFFKTSSTFNGKNEFSKTMEADIAKFMKMNSKPVEVISPCFENQSTIASSKSSFDIAEHISNSSALNADDKQKIKDANP